MNDFQVGQQVVCVIEPCPERVKYHYRQYREATFPIVKAVYTIREIFIVANEVAIRLQEIHNNSDYFADGFLEICFLLSNFRPVKKTDISVFTKMLLNVPKPHNVKEFEKVK